MRDAGQQSTANRRITGLGVPWDARSAFGAFLSKREMRANYAIWGRHAVWPAETSVLEPGVPFGGVCKKCELASLRLDERFPIRSTGVWPEGCF